MRRLISKRLQCDLLTGLLLVALAFHALIPSGFMPAGHGPFSMMICHAGTLAQDPSPQPDRSKHFDHCPFGAAPAAGPMSDIASFQPTTTLSARIDSSFQSLRAGTRRDRAHGPRGPPQLPISA